MSGAKCEVILKLFFSEVRRSVCRHIMYTEICGIINDEERCIHKDGERSKSRGEKKGKENKQG